jgi:hypothetical protein
MLSILFLYALKTKFSVLKEALIPNDINLDSYLYYCVLKWPTELIKKSDRKKNRPIIYRAVFQNHFSIYNGF